MSKAGKEIPKVKTVFGVAQKYDGRKLEHPPQVDRTGAGPKDVKFWLDGTAGAKGGKKATGPALPSNTYISVFDFFKKSKFYRYPHFPS